MSTKVGAVLVAGGGIAGIQASLDLAEAGFYVHLVEKSPAIGGTMAMLDKTFPTNDCSMCILAPKLVECGRHLNIKIHTCAEIKKISGEAGNFTITLKQSPRYVDVDKCKGCDDCARACPVEVKNEFDQGLGWRKAVYKPYAQAFPNAFAIDKRGVSPCRAACPAGVNAQGYIQLIKLGKFKEAWELIYQDLPFPAVCGRICTHPCQSQCHRAEVDEPVNIMNLKRMAADYAYAHLDELTLPEKAEAREEKVAIIGAGPAGLSCAYQLVKKGYQVTVFEAQPVAGGMMRMGIPEYRLPNKWVQLEVDLLTKLGVEIIYNTRLGREVTVDGLLANGYQAVFVGIGAYKGINLDVPGEELAGVIQGLPFLRQVAMNSHMEVGKRVAVIGGGRTAMDCARTAIRLGAEKVVLVYRRAEEELNALPEEVKEAREEGVDFIMQASPKVFHGENGRVTNMECIRNELGEPEPAGKRRTIPVAGSEFMIAVDTVILALGQMADLAGIYPEQNWVGAIEADPETMATVIPGVFAGGDVVTGPQTVIEAVAAGKEAAESIHRYINGCDIKQGREFHVPKEKIASFRFKAGEISPVAAVKVTMTDAIVRKKNFNEVACTYTPEQAQKEAERCLNCGVCSECLECVRACKANAIDHNMTENEVELDAGAVILCPGFEKFDPSNLSNYGYGHYPNVVTSMEFERILSASGPYQGHLVRPGDGGSPRRIAWLQCVGSRDINISGNGYCSSVCCTYALKEAIVAKEHSPGPLETTIFYMDMRTFGKDFERYLNRAQEEYGVRLVRSRIFNVSGVANDEQNLTIRYAAEDGSIHNEEFDLVVLSVGLRPSAGTAGLAATLGINLNHYGFCPGDGLNQVRTSREGIFACGAFNAPQDIPQTVTGAGAAVAEAATLLAPARNTLVAEKFYPAELNITGQEPRLGVFICHCGINIGAVVDVPAVKEYAAALPGVILAEECLYACSQDNQQNIKEKIAKHGLNRIVVASCTPRTHEPLFRETIREAGLNPYLFEMANIREHCAWVHMKEKPAATLKAKELVGRAVARARLLEPLTEIKLDLNREALVIGGGIAGMTAGLKLADQGYTVHLLEKGAALGGLARNIHYTLEGNNVQDFLADLIKRVNGHKLINVYVNSQVKTVSGFVGNFITTIRQESETKDIRHGVAIIAIGGSERRPNEYLYGQHPRVLTAMELENALARNDKVATEVKTAVFIQCVGSRDENHPYCSRVCCSEAVKNALCLLEKNSDAQIYVLYRDMRTYGFKEEFLTRARKQGVMFIRYEPENKPLVQPLNEQKVLVTVTDHVLGRPLAIEADLVALAAAVEAPFDGNMLAQQFKVPLNEDGFFLEAHMKLRPVDFNTDGVFLCGLAHGPKLIEETIAQAEAAATRATTVLSRKKLVTGGVTAYVDPERCSGCRICVGLCPYEAITFNEEEKVAQINEVLCKGCGVCNAACPSRACSTRHFKDEFILAEIEALLA